MSRLSQIALARRSVTLLLAAALFIGGIAAWGSLKQELLPDVSFPIVTVIAAYPGAGAADVTEQVTKPIERAISSVEGVEQLQSNSSNSFAFVIAQFDYGANVDDAVATIEQNLRSVTLPSGVEPSVGAFDFSAAPVVIASVSAMDGTDLQAAAAIARDEIVPQLSSLAGVAGVDLAGGLEDRLVVTLDPVKLAAAGVSVQQIAGVLQANNLTLPAGELPVAGGRIPVSTIGQFASVDAVRNLIVGIRGAGTANPAAIPQPVTLGELGSVGVLSLPTTGYARTNGQPAVTISVSKTSGANTVQVAAAILGALDEAAARHPDEIQIATVTDQSRFIIESSDGLLREGGLGAVFAVLTIFLFLFSVRSTFVAAMSIPLSVLTALVIMQVAGITLNILTLGGLAVAIGRVVDDSIVVLENIYRHRALGEDRARAVLAGPREVAGAITASTLTTVAVFLPLGLAGGFVSQFFLAFSLTVTFALLASLVVALTVVPVLAYLLIGRVSGAVDESGEPKNSLWVHLYDPAIRFVLRNRWTKVGTVAAAALLFFGSVSLVPGLPTAFVNSGSEKILRITVSPPAGTSTDQVLARAGDAEHLLIADPDVALVATTIAGEGDVGFQAALGASLGEAANSARLTVRLHPDVDLQAKVNELVGALAPIGTDGYGVRVTEQAGGTTNGLSVVVSADDPTQVAEVADEVLARLQDEPGLANVTTDLVKAAPEIEVKVDSNKALAVGLTAAQVGTEVRNILTSQTVGRVQLAGGSVPLVLRGDPEALTSLDALRSLPVGTTTKVPLGTIADVEQAEVQARITRIDELPSATISGEITSGDTGATSQAVQAVIDDLRDGGKIPAAVTVELGGVTAQQAEAFGGLFASMAVAVLLVYLAMVLAFNSLLTPFIILFSLPLAAIGAFPALLLTGRPIGISSLIGFLMLIGIVVTNAIVLLDLVERLRASGHSTHDALVEGGKTRIRPILMTAIATILALVPLAAGFNEGSIIAAELGTVVIGGLLSSTLLTLLVVPVVYSLVDSVKRRAGASAG